jgi:hypothetical protein
MLRHGHHKLLVHSNGQGELYDLASDPSEVVNLFDEPQVAHVRQELLWRLVQWLLRVRTTCFGRYTIKTARHNWAGASQHPQRDIPGGRSSCPANSADASSWALGWPV